jgi:outer membrane scaffolding protein for murein synthesis (MipA/OmpV family)
MSRQKRHSLACALAASAILVPMAAYAQGQPGTRLQPITGNPVTDSGGWVVTLRANAVGGPKFPGSSDTGFIAFPSGSIRSAGSPVRFSTPDDGPSLALYDTGFIRAGLTARYQTGRYTSDDRRLAGIRDAKWAIEPGAFVDIWAVPDTLRARFEIRRGFHGHEGVVGNFGLDLVQRFGQWTVSAGPRVYVADAEYMKSYFGVTGQDAAWNPRVRAYKPDGGLKGYGVAGAITYQINEAWAVTGHARYERLAKQAADSPIVKSFGKRDQISFGATLSYSFLWR